MKKENTLGAVSTCKNGGEKFVYFNLNPRNKKSAKYVQYEYRDPATEELFSCVAPTIEQCRDKRDKWLKNRY